ncbi:metal ABC transporter substrate-binding protein [Streptomyces bambusae]|uniref:metal ABC transporter substrate-binding protein n=1 Tax=Streptomyces bambusae TaxID=1550616 RepID=UPI001CFEC5AF|nr:metal ABC transporter substrate-binding protein [Streptomyces bambusae]MCB5164063.1 metal ABC transporter substrate-binding protein [Streptomyces bambusae]
MARTRGRIPSLLALTASLALVAGCGGADGGTADGRPADRGKAGGNPPAGSPVVVATTTWEGALAKAAGAENVTVIVPQSVQHAPDYDPKPSDLAAVAKADFVLYAPFEPYAGKIKEAAGSKAQLVEVGLDNDADKTAAEVARLGAKFGTQARAGAWQKTFRAEYAKLAGQLRSAWPGGRQPQVVAQVFTAWSAKMAGAGLVGTYGPEAVTPGRLAELTAKKPQFVLDNAHMTTGRVLPGAGAEQLEIVNYPGEDLDLLGVYRKAADEIGKALAGS